jgi:hypothetical protein
MGVSDDTAQEYRQIILSLKSWLEQRGVSSSTTQSTGPA